MHQGAVPMPGQMQGAGVGVAPMQAWGATMSVDDRKFAAADTDGDGLVSEQEARDYLNYHAVADTDGDGKIDLKELVRYLQPIEQQVEQQTANVAQHVDGLEQQRQAQLAQIEQLRRELASMGVSDEEMTEAARKEGSSLCTIM